MAEASGFDPALESRAVEISESMTDTDESSSVHGDETMRDELPFDTGIPPGSRQERRRKSRDNERASARRRQAVEDVNVAEELAQLQREKALLEQRAKLIELRKEVDILRSSASVANESEPLTTTIKDSSGGSGPYMTGAIRVPAVGTPVAAGDMPAKKRTIRPKDTEHYHGKTVKEHLDYVRSMNTAFRMVPEDFQTHEQKIVYAMQFLKGEPKNAWYQYEEEHPSHIFTFEQYCRFLLDLVEGPVNRQLLFAQEFQDARQGEKQTAQAFDSHLSYLEAQLHPFTEEQRRMNFFTRLRPALRAALTNFQNIPDRRENLVTLATRLETNIKRHDSVTTAPSDRPKGSKNARRKSSKYKKEDDAQSADEKPKHEDKKSKKKRTRPLAEVTCYNCEQKGHYATKCPNASKDAKVKADVNAVEQTGKGKPLKKKARRSSGAADE